MLGSARSVARSSYKQSRILSGRLCIREAPALSATREYWWGKKATPPSQPVETQGFDSPSNTGGINDEPVMKDSAAGADDVQTLDSKIEVTSELPGDSTQIDPAGLGAELGGSGIDQALTSAAADVAPVMLEQGYFPTDFLRQGVDLLHTTTGLPYWIVVVGGTLTLRTLLLPLHLKSMRMQSKLVEVTPQLTPIREEIMALANKHRDEGDEDGSKRARMAVLKMKMNAIQDKHGVGPSTFLTPILINGFIFSTCFIGLQDMGKYFPGWSQGGTAWFTDLNLPDTTYYLPGMAGVALYGLSRCMVVDPNNPMTVLMPRVLGVFSVLLVPFAATMPSGVVLYMVTANTFSAVQNFFLTRPSIRKVLSLPPLPTINAQAKPGSQDFRAKVKSAEPWQADHFKEMVDTITKQSEERKAQLKNDIGTSPEPPIQPIHTDSDTPAPVASSHRRPRRKGLTRRN